MKWPILLVALALLVGGRWLAVRRYQECYHSRLQGCVVALEMYAADSHGQYPSSPALLTPNYLRSVPTCPASGRPYLFRGDPSGYSVICGGRAHWAAGVARPDVPWRSTAFCWHDRPDPRPAWRRALDL